MLVIIDRNTLAAIGLKNILQSIIPMANVYTFMSVEDMIQACIDDEINHYFVSTEVMLSNMDYFCRIRNKTIVLSHSIADNTSQNKISNCPSGFHSICVNQPEKQLIKQLLILEQHAHKNGRNLPAPSMNQAAANPLTNRETEVMTLIVKGYINKEIADILNIAITTVISHRKNIMDKLQIKSVSALTIYAVMHGYVDISDI
ncbi:response regulator transcription factor [Xylanibacter muris]|uniref:Response regulator transcription factor n=1 Tax=Xylanibacter muris TaxID=2736290 RepID=A0ABX2AL02_9BACT|nr:response regulator transcription factor [Xylanibacter muris]NPD91455.1 response regulator transcription factor [Xylanibacter muris]